MNVNYIVVQAGGKGSRMKYLTRNKPKALVPVGNLPMLFHLFRQFPEKEYIIIADYKAEAMKKYLQAFAGVKYLVVDTGGKKGTCSGIKNSLDVIPEGEQFMLVWSDIILPDAFIFPEENSNYIGISKDFLCRWSYKDGLLKEEDSLEHGVAGLFIFKNKAELSNIPEEGEFVKWLSEYDKCRFEEIPLYHAKEYGLFDEYNKYVDGIDGGSRCRPFNKIEIDGDRIIKQGIDEQGMALAVREREWYKTAAEKGIENIPDIYSYDPLVMQRIHGLNIFQCELDLGEKKAILGKLVEVLRNVHASGSVPTDRFSIYEAYVGKTFRRLDKIRDMVPFADKEYIVINGRPCRNIFFYKKEVEKLFENYDCREFVFLHGDNTFSNIMIDEKLTPILIDPRGYFGYTEMYGDPNYDWAKLYYSLLGNYDQFNLKHFQLSINEGNIELNIQSNGWEELEEYFFELLGNSVKRDDIRLIHAIIWLSLTTYAWEDYDSICGAFYNGLLYLEDIFVKYLDGIEKEDAKNVNLSFEDTMRIFTNSLRSVDENIYEQLLGECVDALRNGHKIIASGLGKNVPVCEKFVGSMVSMGLNALFLHTNNAVHGDMGIVKEGDLVIIITKSGSTSESVYLADKLSERKGVNLWLLTFRKHSILSEKIKALVIELEHEGDLWNIMPNNSTILNLIVLQSLAMHLAKRMNIQLEDFKPNHPGGAIGNELR